MLKVECSGFIYLLICPIVDLTAVKFWKVFTLIRFGDVCHRG